MRARFERTHVLGPFEMEILGSLGAEEAFNRRVVQAVALAAHALLDCASHEHRSIGLHPVVLALANKHDRQQCQRTPNGLKSGQAGVDVIEILSHYAHPRWMLFAQVGKCQLRIGPKKIRLHEGPIASKSRSRVFTSKLAWAFAY